MFELGNVQQYMLLDNLLLKHINNCYSTIGGEVDNKYTPFHNCSYRSSTHQWKYGPMEKSAAFLLSPSESLVLKFSPGNLTTHDSQADILKKLHTAEPLFYLVCD